MGHTQLYRKPGHWPDCCSGCAGTGRKQFLNILLLFLFRCDDDKSWESYKVLWQTLNFHQNIEPNTYVHIHILGCQLTISQSEYQWTQWLWGLHNTQHKYKNQPLIHVQVFVKQVTGTERTHCCSALVTVCHIIISTVHMCADINSS